MTSVLVLLLIVVMTLLINRIATVALTLTGMSREMARFQARSALSTTGYTTGESESLVNHPVRRRIVFWLMMIGNAGFVGVLATLMVSLTEGQDSTFSLMARVMLILAGLAGIWLISTSKWVDDRLFRIISWALKRWTTLDVHDFQDLLHLGEGYAVTEVRVEPGDWLVGKPLSEVRLSEAGVNVLAVHRRSGDFVGAPVGETYIRGMDRLIVYGLREDVMALDMAKGEETGWERHLERMEVLRASRKAAAGDERSGQRADPPKE